MDAKRRHAAKDGLGHLSLTLDGLEEQFRFSSRVVTQDILTGWAARANHISVNEMLGVLAAIEWLAPKCRGKRITLLFDSECVEGALVKGVSNALDLADMVPTDSNVSDQVSRGSFLEVEKRGGTWVDQTPPPWTMSGAAWQAELDRREQTAATQARYR